MMQSFRRILAIVLVLTQVGVGETKTWGTSAKGWRLTARANKAEFTLGGPILLTIRIQNEAQEERTWQTFTSFVPFDFEVLSTLYGNHVPIPKLHTRPVSIRPITLKPGEHFDSIVRLDRVVPLGPGRYQITVRRYLNAVAIFGNERQGAEFIKSAPIEVVIREN